jgi:RNA polymerase sigma-70 factor, ECF subfamily
LFALIKVALESPIDPDPASKPDRDGASAGPKRRVEERRQRVSSDATQAALFERLVLPHADGAFNLARWLTCNDADADDVVQEAMLRAFRFIDRFDGENPRAWFLSIVRNACFTWLKRNRPRDVVPLDDQAAELSDGSGTVVPLWVSDAAPADLQLERQADRALLDRLIEALPADGREIIVLRELEELSYREIAEVVGVPIGTVMSRLARARKRLLGDWQRAVARGRPA